MRHSTALLLAAGMLAASAGSAWGQGRRDGNLMPGDAAPDFTVRDVQGRTAVTLSTLRGKPTVLIFGSCT